MFLKLLKIALFVGILSSSTTILITKILPPSRETLILIFYMIIVSSIATSLVIYYEIYWKENRIKKKIFETIKEIQNLKKDLRNRVEAYESVILSRSQSFLLIEKALLKMEEKIEKIEKEFMDICKC